MDYKIVEKDTFTVIGLSRVFQYENAMEVVPKLWAEFDKSEKCDEICSTYGINIDESMSGNEFEYLIADNYNAAMDIPEGFVTRVRHKGDSQIHVSCFYLQGRDAAVYAGCKQENLF